MGLLIPIIVTLLFVSIVVWRREIAAFIGHLWLYAVIAKDTCFGEAKLADLRDTTYYRMCRSAKAELDMEEFLHSTDLALFATAHQRRRDKFHIPLWELRGNFYFIDLIAREVKCTNGNITLASSIETALDEFREVCPNFDPYMCFRFRLTNAMNLVEDYGKMEED